MANQDKDRLAGTEEGALDDPAGADGNASASDPQASRGEDMRRGNGAQDDGGGGDFARSFRKMAFDYCPSSGHPG